MREVAEMPRTWRFAAVGALLVVVLFALVTTREDASGLRPPVTEESTSAGRAILGGMSLSEGLSLGQTVPMPNPSIDLRKPMEEDLNGYQFSLHVLGYGEEPSVSCDFGAYSAPPDAAIAVVSYDLEYEDSSGGNAVLAFLVDGQSFPIADSELQGQWTVGVAVPAAYSVILTASEEGFTQRLSLATGIRVGSSPAELYRSPAGPDLTEQVGATVSLRVVGRSVPFHAIDQLTLDSVTLTYFSPLDPTVQPSSVNDAYLVLDASEQTAPASDYGLIWDAALPASRMRLVLPDGRVIQADPSSTPTIPYPSNLLDGTYFFDVPGSFTQGTIEITPGTYRAVELLPGGAGGADGPVSAVGTAKFRISFPPPPKVISGRPGRRSSRPGAVSRTTRPVRGRARPVSHHTGFPVIPLGALLFGVLAAAACVWRMRATRPFAVDSDLHRVRPRPALPPVPRLALMPGPAWVREETEASDGDDSPETTAVAGPAPAGSTVGIQVLPSELAEAPVISLFGVVQISGCRVRPTRARVVELACYLACHPGRRFTADQLSCVLWPPDVTDRGRGTSVRHYAWLLRKSMGTQFFPEADYGGYGLAPSVTTDVARFYELVRASESVTGNAARELLRSALGLVQGEPFAGTDYSWVSDERLAEPIEIAVVAAARSLVAKSLAAADAETALFAVDRGLLLSRDPGLCEDLLRAAAATESRSIFDKAWNRLKRMTDSDADLAALHDKLLACLRDRP